MSPNPPRPETSLPRTRGDAWAVGGLVAMAALLFRRHLLGQALFLGNFDRLNSFLNVLEVHARGWRTHTFGAWDESMFMGRNLFALPFTYPNVLNYLVSLFPADRIFWAAGYVSMGLLCASAVASFAFLRDLCRDRYAAFVGAALYELSALSTLKVGQNDMSFAVLIHIPLILLLLRGIRPGSLGPRFALLALVLSHLFIFCFLQKVAYAMLLTGLYALFLSSQRRSWLPVALASGSTVVALIASFPRVFGVVREIGELRRMVAPGFDMKNFDALYAWQNFRGFDFLRWFQDGIFGRFNSEKDALRNNLNITEGMLLYCGPLVPFLLMGALVRWRGRWMGLFRDGQREALFFASMVALAFGVIMSKDVYHLIFILFLRMDFTHTRIIIAALLPLCGLIALMVGRWREENPPEPGRPVLNGVLFAAAAGAAFAASIGIEAFAGRIAGPQGFELTDSWADLGRQLGRLAPCAWSGATFEAPPLTGQFLAWMKTSVVAQVAAYAVLAAAGAAAVAFGARRPRRSSAAAFAVLACGNLLVIDAYRYADFQVNDEHVRTVAPFFAGNSYMPRADEFVPPSASEMAEVHEQLESTRFRTVLLTHNDSDLPLFLAPHIGAFWSLRLVEGYSTGVPLRLGVLPWPTDVVGLRTLRFAGIDEAKLPWRLLAFLNVKYGLYVNLPFYKDTPPGQAARGAGGPLGTQIIVNPYKAVPREFFPESVDSVKTMQEALGKIFPGTSTDPALDPVSASVVESMEPLALGDNGGGDVHATYRGDEISLEVSPSPRERLLVLDELYHPDWHAYSGSRPLHVFPANVVMRGVLVPAGSTELTLRFEPFGSMGRLGLSCCAALAVAALLAALCGRYGPDSWFRLETA
jgi:hypothetical protein